MAMQTGLIFHPYMRPGRTARQTVTDAGGRVARRKQNATIRPRFSIGTASRM